LLGAAESAGVAVERVDGRALDELRVGEHQGVAAYVAPPEEVDDAGLARMSLDGALVVVLDGIEDPQNFGACARAAEAAGAAVLVSRERRAAPITPAAVKASAGALLHLPLARVTNVARTIAKLQDRGVTVAGLDHRAEGSIHDTPVPDRPVAVVVGAEGAGMSRLVREACDTLVSIPMAGRTGSLNAASALAVALFGWALRPPRAG
jgi:23S rRNA (guanosine2251-2'-O)-methyltransferase